MIFLTEQNGFTLLESIITLIVLSIIGSMMYSYFNTITAHGAVPLIQIQKSLDLQSAMEKMTADYHDIIGNGENIDKLQNRVATNEYGTYFIKTNVFIKFVSGAEVEILDTDPRNILKVTIYNDIDETLTSLFTDPNL